MEFEWDPAKAESNWRKHEVRFETAIRAFKDPLLLSEPDQDEHDEYRWQTFGMVDGVLLLVVHTDREENGIEIVRIISAREATRKERRRYEQDG